jgi:hypothetical protein
MLAVAIAIVLNGLPMTTSVPSELDGGRLFVPWSAFVRQVARAGSYDPQSGAITIVGADHRLRLTVGSRDAFLDDRPVVEAAAPYASDGDVFVPLAAIAPVLGLRVRYDGHAREVAIGTGPGGVVTTPTPYARPLVPVPSRTLFTPQPTPAPPRPTENGTPHARRTPIAVYEPPP